MPQGLFAYNTTVHSSTDYSPYKLIFGRKPYLPVDALLRHLEVDIMDGEVGEWVQQHQEHNNLAYNIAKRHLEGAAAKRARQKPRENVAPFPVCTVVYQRNHVHGRNKIQDVWGLTKYRVI